MAGREPYKRFPPRRFFGLSVKISNYFHIPFKKTGGHTIIEMRIVQMTHFVHLLGTAARMGRKPAEF